MMARKFQHNRNVHFRVTEEIHDRLVSAADAANMGVSEYLRALVTRFVVRTSVEESVPFTVHIQRPEQT